MVHIDGVIIAGTARSVVVVGAAAAPSICGVGDDNSVVNKEMRTLVIVYYISIYKVYIY